MEHYLSAASQAEHQSMSTKCTTTVAPASLIWNGFQSIKNSFNKNHYTNVFVIVNFNDDAADLSITMTCKQVKSSRSLVANSLLWIKHLLWFSSYTFILITNLKNKPDIQQLHITD